MGKKNICPTKPYIRLHSQHSGKLPTKIKTPFSKKSNDMPKNMLKQQTMGMNFLKEKKFSAFGMSIASSVGKKQ